MRLKEIRKLRGLSGYDVAEYLEISPQYYYQLEREDNRISSAMLEKLAIFYGVTVDDLLGLGKPGPGQVKPIEEDWPEVAKVLRNVGLPSERDRKRIAKILKLAIDDSDDD